MATNGTTLRRFGLAIAVALALTVACKHSEHRRVHVYEGPERQRQDAGEPRTVQEEEGEYEMVSPGRMVVE